MGREVAQDPAAAVEKHEDGKSALHASRPDNRERERLPVDVIVLSEMSAGCSGTVTLFCKPTSAARASSGVQLLHWLAAAGVQRVEELGDAPVDVGLTMLVAVAVMACSLGSECGRASAACARHGQGWWSGHSRQLNEGLLYEGID